MEAIFIKIQNHFHFKENYSLEQNLRYFRVLRFQVGGKGGNEGSEVTLAERITGKHTLANDHPIESSKALWWFVLRLSGLFPYALPEHLFNLGRELGNSFAFLPLDANLVEGFKLRDHAP